MKRIPLTRGQFALVDDEDFGRVSRFKWCAYFSPRARLYYAVRRSTRVNGESHIIWMHRFIMNAGPGTDVDHTHHDTLDNRKKNLRLASHEDNCRNNSMRRNNTSGFKGVSLHTKNRKWRAYINPSGRQKHLGLYLCPEDAARAYDAAALEHFGEFALTNKMLGLLK